jgi:DNA-binding protein HU-beta
LDPDYYLIFYLEISRLKMNKSELVDYIANKTGLTKKDAANAVNAFIEAVMDSVKRDKPVTLTNFGTFLSVHRAATMKRNPKTGAAVKVAAKRVPRFRPGKAFKEAVVK